ncbi:uncharacterized protein PFL1_04241 [Pseudozyma flocculosa PF-1]|uniref:GmrSD restriction endonucleases N-terminal domain-containing protein n=2 Tax=Pseudozyma flocculosa TaxID=84751 RepID=A0A5C3ETI4_9BASI|nr:uncharacterized protein PFL1_04241 [Pseudozyma flocculosa PF-1]EPQ28414.1 hypothetical protein PFL1_04241 [Pseudozyma flocculosa PF-1]SPO35578.1 uncharacterized protein PSFLO_01049 [Pseudozyma flocculosa]
MSPAVTATNTPHQPSKDEIKADDAILDIEPVQHHRRATQYTTRAVFDMIQTGAIADVAPDPRRGPRWSARQQSGFLDSILRRCYVPPLLFSVFSNSGVDTLYCIDGKQRLTTLHDFMANKLAFQGAHLAPPSPTRLGPVPAAELEPDDGVVLPPPPVDATEPETDRKFWFKESIRDGKTPALSQLQRERFEAEPLICVEQSGLTPDDEQDLYWRVQRGLVPNAAEKLSEHLGPWPDFIRQLAAHYVKAGLQVDARGQRLIDVSEGNDFLFAAQVALVILHAQVRASSVSVSSTSPLLASAGLTPTSLRLLQDPNFLPVAPAIADFFKANLGVAPGPGVGPKIKATFETYVALAKDRVYGGCLAPSSNPRELNRQRPLAPIELVHVGLLISYFPKAEVSQLYQAVKQMTAPNRPRPPASDALRLGFTSTAAADLRNFVTNLKLPNPINPRTEPDRRRQHDDSGSSRERNPYGAAWSGSASPSTRQRPYEGGSPYYWRRG